MEFVCFFFLYCRFQIFELWHISERCCSRHSTAQAQQALHSACAAEHQASYQPVLQRRLLATLPCNPLSAVASPLYLLVTRVALQMETISKYIINLSATKSPFNVSENHSGTRVKKRIKLNMATHHSQKKEHYTYVICFQTCRYHVEFEVPTAVVRVRCSAVVKALCYKPEGSGFDT
jgi:hypothetical protein